MNCAEDLKVNRTHNSVLRTRFSHSNITVGVVVIGCFALSASLSLSRAIRDGRLGSNSFSRDRDTFASLAPFLIGETADLFHLARRLDWNGKKDRRSTDVMRLDRK